MKKTPLRRKTPLRSKMPYKAFQKSDKLRNEKGGKGVSKRKIDGKKIPSRVKRSKLPSIKSLRDRCDNLLTPVIKKLYPYSILSGAPTEVAHHHVHKSKSNVLRYYIPNLIPLTGAEHVRLHNNESYWASRIIQIRGLAWFEDLERKKNAEVKVNREWYEENLKLLQEILQSNTETK